MYLVFFGEVCVLYFFFFRGFKIFEVRDFVYFIIVIFLCFVFRIYGGRLFNLWRLIIRMNVL